MRKSFTTFFIALRNIKKYSLPANGYVLTLSCYYERMYSAKYIRGMQVSLGENICMFVGSILILAPNAPNIKLFAGYPSIMVPAGFTSDGMPLGVTFIGKEYSEPTLLRIAYAFEQVTKARVSPGSICKCN